MYLYDIYYVLFSATLGKYNERKMDTKGRWEKSRETSS